MPGPDPHTLWIDDDDPGRPAVSWQPYFWTGNNGNRRNRAIAILKRLRRGTWRCLLCGDDLPEYLRADAVYCSTGCRKRAARERRTGRGRPEV